MYVGAVVWLLTAVSVCVGAQAAGAVDTPVGENNGASDTESVNNVANGADEVNSAMADIISECGSTLGCYLSPDGCSGSDCDFIVGYTPGDGYTDFVMAAKRDESLGENQYVAIGFSPTGGMSDSPVIDCIYYDGGFIIQDSYNEGHQNNVLDDASVGILSSSGAVEDGFISCSVRRVNSDPDEPLLGNLEGPSYLIIAQGAVTDEAVKEHHKTKLSSASTIDFTMIPGADSSSPLDDIVAECGSTLGCYLSPEGCTGSDCDFIVGYTPGDGYTDFVMAAKRDESLGDNQYVAIGFSPDGGMSDSPVIDCIEYHEFYLIQDSYNEGHQNTVLDDNSVGILSSSGSTVDGFVSCNVRRVNSDPDEPLLGNLEEPSYLIIAQGAVTGESVKEHHKTKLASASTIDFTMIPGSESLTQAGLISADLIFAQCGVTIGCFITPEGCTGSDCDFIVGYAPGDGYIDFSYSAKMSDDLGDDQYVAIGFSPDGGMGNSPVIDCIYYGGAFNVQDSYNEGHSNQVLEDSQRGILSSSGAAVDGYISCTVRRVNSDPAEPLLRNLADPKYLIIAQGSATSATHKNKHETHLSSPTQIDFTSVDLPPVEESSGGYGFRKAHGILMTLSWAFLAGFGIIHIRYMKDEFQGHTVCGLPVWFANHRNALSLAVFMTLLAALLLLFHLGGYVVLQETPSILNTHPNIGLIVTVLAVLNALMSIFRGGKDAKYRWLFNQVHRAIGEIAMILGYFNVLTGASLSKSEPIVSDTTFWLLVCYGIMHVLVEICLWLMDECDKNDKNRQEEEETQKLQEDDLDDGTKSKLLSGKVMILGIYTVVGGAIAVVATLSMACA